MPTPNTDYRPLLESERERLRARLDAINVLLGEEQSGANHADGNGNGSAAAPPPAGRRGPGVSQTILDAVREYMEKNGEVRQVEVSRDLGTPEKPMNSGSVSLALRWLESQNEVQDTRRVINKSKVWRFVGEPSRVTNVEPGEGISPGRRRSTD